MSTRKPVRVQEDQSSFVYVVMGDPVPLARPRFSNKVVWDSQKEQKLLFGLHVRKQHGNRPLLEGPLFMDVSFYMKLPIARKYRRGKNIGDYHQIRPDLSNMLKFIEDACSGVIYHDDCTIAAVRVRKVYDSQPRTEFSLIALKGAYEKGNLPL